MSKTKNEIKEVLTTDLLGWYERLGNNPSNELMEEFDKEVQNWNLYDLTYHFNENGRPRWIREYGITLPHVLRYLQVYFPLGLNFNHKERKIEDLVITPHNEEFRSKKLNDGSYQGSSDRSGSIQYYNLIKYNELVEHQLKNK